MKKRIPGVLPIVLLPIVLLALSLGKTSSVEIMLKTNGLDIHSKSYLGWARVINSTSKRKCYNIQFNPNKLSIYLKELKELNAKTKNRKIRQ